MKGTDLLTLVFIALLGLGWLVAGAVLDVGIGCFSHYETVQGTIVAMSWPPHGSGIVVTIGDESITFHDPENACTLEIGKAYRLKYVTTYHRTRLVHYELLPPIPCT